MDLISHEELKQYIMKIPDSSTLIVDVRPILEFDLEHIDNTVNIPLDDINAKGDEYWIFDTIIALSTREEEAKRACEILHSIHPQNILYTHGQIKDFSQAGIRIVKQLP